jgi:hypothetical protein
LAMLVGMGVMPFGENVWGFVSQYRLR